MSYDEHDAARIVAEPAKRPGRTPFERDRARILHSAGWRRLSAKTQILAPGADDFVRNRLTHSLEVAQIGRGLGKTLGCEPDIVDAACLAHDLGHPPFGHNGEYALNREAGEVGGFEGNAQTFRLLTRLESKAFDADGASAGLNLTRATLDAVSKYPWGSGEQSGTKYGYYHEDALAFSWMRSGLLGTARCIEADVMDAADDIGYSVHDVEDGIAAGTLDLTTVLAQKQAYFDFAREFSPSLQTTDLDAAWRRLASLPNWPTGAYDGSRSAQAGLKNLTSDLIGRFVSTVAAATREAYGWRPLTRHSAALVIPDEIGEEIGLLKGLGMYHVTYDAAAIENRDRERQVIADLVGGWQSRPDLLRPPYSDDYASAESESARLRVIIDQVAGLTDPDAWVWQRVLAKAQAASG